MSKREIIVYKVLEAKPVPNDIMPSELLSFLNYQGVSYRNAKGSHIIVEGTKKDGSEWHYTIPTGHPGPIKSIYISKLRQFIKEE